LAQAILAQGYDLKSRSGLANLAQQAMAELARAGLPGVSKSEKQAINCAVPSREAQQSTSRDPHQLAGSIETNGDLPTMKHNDLQLTEMLRLARSCLKYDRVPGEMSEQKYFDKFDAEHASTELADKSLDASVSTPLEDSKSGMSLELSPRLEGPGEDPPDARTVRSQTAQIEAITAEARLKLEEAMLEYNQEVMKRLKLEKDEESVKNDFQKNSERAETRKRNGQEAGHRGK